MRSRSNVWLSSALLVAVLVTAIAAMWMQWTIHRMLHAAAPALAGKIDHHPDDYLVAQTPAAPVAVGTTTERTDG